MTIFRSEADKDFNLTEADVVLVTKEHYQELLQDQEMLDALHAFGVDNWEGYSEAMMSLDPDDEDQFELPFDEEDEDE